ncbi:MAG: sulfite exporter TauE/SafE family protein [Sedimentisphaerales bacterium]|nr:sulfite exporter TauE/SafE family protein [Sedimentisphaerales bacterium]
MNPEVITGLIFFGLLVGIVGTLIGAGGGFLIMPVFLIFYREKGLTVLTAASLAVICANAISGSIAYARMRRINYHAGLLFAIAAAPGAITGVLIIDYIPAKAFEILFGLTMILVGTYLFASVEKRLNPLQADAKSIPTYDVKVGMGISTVVGLLSSLLGIGGGVIHVPMMVYVLNFPVHLATATSHFTLAIMTMTGTIVHIYEGNLAGQWRLVLILAAGVIAGAQIGAAISPRIKSAWIIKFLAVAIAIVGLRIMYL